MSSIAAGGFLAASGALLLARTLPDLVRGIQSRGWPLLPGTIERAEYVVGAGRRSARTIGPEVAADWLVTYRYDAPTAKPKGGRQLRGNCLRFGPMSRRDARNYVAALAPGQATRVAVNPRKHDQAVLIAGPAWQSALAVGAAVAIALAGLVWMLA